MAPFQFPVIESFKDLISYTRNIYFKKMDAHLKKNECKAKFYSLFQDKDDR